MRAPKHSPVHTSGHLPVVLPVVLAVSPYGFLRKTSGAALVEFALLLPILLLIFAVMIEGSRTFWAYQAVISGVRDASRYVSRVVPRDICTSGGSLAGLNATLADIVSQDQTGNSHFPSAITISGVVASYTCPAGNFRSGSAPIATVTATITIQYPFANVFVFSGGDLSSKTTSVSDQVRVYGT